MQQAETQFGVGAYTPGEAARLLSMPPNTLRRWLYGVSSSNAGAEGKAYLPLWTAQYDFDPDEPIIGFRDLIEARTVRKLRAIGLGLPTIRQCLKAAREIAKDSHPFSTRKLRTDGKRLFLQTVDQAGSMSVIDLKANQHAFAKVVDRTFLDLEFDGDVASRWWLNPEKKSLVIDPERSFGQPIAAESGIPTRRLAEAVEVEGSARKVARLFDLPISVVNDAVKFEKQLLLAA